MENKYANTLLESIGNIKFGLKYYIERCLELENELKVYRKMYENRVNEYIKLLKENEKKEDEKNAINFLKETNFDYLDYDMCVSSVETTSNLVVRLQKENEQLKEINEELSENKLLQDIEIKKNFISKQKIKDKIEDLKMSGGSDGKDNTENTARELVIEVLQDILDESEG